MALFFEWDSAKAETNKEKHRIAFEEAATVFGDKNSITIDDIAHSENEKREITIGTSMYDQILVVVYTVRDKNIRIISARKANKKEKIQYLNF